MVEAAADAAAIRRAYHHGARVLARRAPAQLGELADDLVERGIDEVHELDLGDRPHTVHGHADRAADDAVFGQRRVGDAVGAELSLQALGDPEHAAVSADVLAQHDDFRVRAQGHAQRVRDRLHHRHLWHVCSPVGFARTAG